MDVFLVPVGGERYELYCEVADAPEPEDADEPPRGFFRRFLRGLKQRFNDMLAEAERERRQGQLDAEPPPGWLGRLKRRMMRWVAESIAEQRLLWSLRKCAAATMHYPADMAEPAAVELLRAQLGRDFDKHQFWMIIDALAFVASGLLAIIPGPNLVAYYFAFRLVGHYLSLRGAGRALRDIVWTHTASPPLAELRGLVQVEPAARAARVDAIASALGLEYLPLFFARTATPS